MRDTVAAIVKHGTIVAAARALGMPRGTLQGRYREAKSRGIATDQEIRTIAAQAFTCADPALRGHNHQPISDPDVDPPDDAPEARPKVLDPMFEKEWQTFASEIGMRQNRYKGPCRRPARVGRLKLLVVPDIHAPFHERGMIAEMLSRESDADVAVIMGDIGDGYAFSRFIKYENVTFEQELAAVTQLLETFSERFPRVVLIVGNHDAPRLEKQLRDRLNPEMVQAIQAMTGGTLDPIEALCRQRFPNVELASHGVGRHRVRWMTQIGDAIFCHAEKYSITPGAAVRKIEEWFADMEGHLKLAPWRVIFQAHTHMFSWIPWHADKLLVEVGCLCQVQGYTIGARIGGRPQRRGYVTVEQTDGKTDINSVRIVWLDAEQPVGRIDPARPDEA